MKNTYLESKPRYEILDGLRGVAAVCVVLYHLAESYGHTILDTVMTHGFLAVDFFFALSGFVIGYAYDDRWDRMSIGGFFKRRITRLHPMVVMGVAVGLCFFYYTGDCPDFSLVDQAPWWKVLLFSLLLICMIPLPRSMDIRGWGELTSIDGPVWTLMYEYIGNILYALFFRFLPKWGLAVCLGLAAIISADHLLNLNMFGLLVTDNYAYTAAGGFFFDPEHVYIAFSRLLYPFISGLLLSRVGTRIKARHGFLIASLMILAVLASPKMGGDNRIVDGGWQLFSIIAIFPLILAVGAGSTISGKKATAVCMFLGDISYPLYITHYPLIYMHVSWVQRHPDAPLGTNLMICAATLAIALGIAYGSLKLYDEPLREWLKEHWLKKNTVRMNDQPDGK